MSTVGNFKKTFKIVRAKKDLHQIGCKFLIPQLHYSGPSTERWVQSWKARLYGANIGPIKYEIMDLNILCKFIYICRSICKIIDKQKYQHIDRNIIVDICLATNTQSIS